jgi:hypothetical protein
MHSVSRLRQAGYVVGVAVLGLGVSVHVAQYIRCGYMIGSFVISFGPPPAERRDINGCRVAPFRELGRDAGRWLFGQPSGLPRLI